MPGTMFLSATERGALVKSGAAWNRVVATSTADAGTPDLANINSIVQTKVLVQALRWAADGGGVGRDAIINKVKAVVGTETKTDQPLNPYRQIATWIVIADLVDMPGTTVCANGQTFDAWVASLPDKVLPGQSNWNTVRKCARFSGNNWGFYAKPALLAIGLWLNNASIIAEARSYFRRAIGITSEPNTFTPSGAFSGGWDGPSTTYPSTQGVLNPVSSNKDLNGANSEDASRGSSAPPLTGSGLSYTMEAVDGILMTATLLHHAGDTDVWQWADSAIKRNAVSIDATNANWNGSNHIYWFAPHLINHVYGTSLPVKTLDSYGSRAMPYCTDWLAQSSYLRSAIPGGGTGGGGTGAVVPPDVNAVAAVSGTTVTVNAATTVAGTNAIASHTFAWGDGVTDTVAEPTRSGSHTYAAAGAKIITVTATDTAGNTDVMQLQVSTIADQPPVAVVSVSKTFGPVPLTTVVDTGGSGDPDGTAVVKNIDWGDGSSTPNVSGTATHTYNAPGTYTGRLDVVSNGATTSTNFQVVVSDPQQQAPWVVLAPLNGEMVPVQPQYDSTWNGWHLRMGSWRFWVDASGNFRKKNGAPTSDTDGAIV